MKVKVTATVTYEMLLDPADYVDEDGTVIASTDEEIIAWELQQVKDEPDDSYVLSNLTWDGVISDVKIEKVEEPAAEAA